MASAKQRASLSLWRRRLAYRKARWRLAKHRHDHVRASKWMHDIHEAAAEIHKIEHARNPLRIRAYKVARGQVGVMESGGNNKGLPWSRYERPGGASAPEPWCGDFQAYCYRKAGSKAVTRSWAAVRLLPLVSGVVKRRFGPRQGDLVRYTFDHVGMFVRDNHDGTITTVEGNTGASGAVSDGNGQDGVYIKVRSKALVKDYLAVLR